MDSRSFSTRRGRRQYVVNCADCYVDTVRTGNWYLVRDEIWQEATPDSARILCLECLSRRLGRSLLESDFALSAAALRARTS
jgi:hypothetical protein